METATVAAGSENELGPVAMNRERTMGKWKPLDDVEGRRRRRVDPLWWGIAVALGGVVAGMVAIVAG